MVLGANQSDHRESCTLSQLPCFRSPWPNGSLKQLYMYLTQLRDESRQACGTFYITSLQQTQQSSTFAAIAGSQPAAQGQQKSTVSRRLWKNWIRW